MDMIGAMIDLCLELGSTDTRDSARDESVDLWVGLAESESGLDNSNRDGWKMEIGALMDWVLGNRSTVSGRVPKERNQR